MTGLVTTVKGKIPRKIRRQSKLLAARAFESVGADLFSHPALNDLDRKILPYLGSDPGLFLEIGANDGYSQSNTYYLERRLGWKGILIEPVPGLYQRCQRLRQASKCFNLACVGAEGPDAVDLMDLDLMSVALGQQSQDEEFLRLSGHAGVAIRVEATTLSDVIDRAEAVHVDFMSIDVEGAELQVIAGLDLGRHTPSWLLVETAHSSEVTSLLSGHMQFEAQLSHHDYLFRSLGL